MRGEVKSVRFQGGWKFHICVSTEIQIMFI